MNDKKVDVLAIAPHPDDIEMSCGGTMLKLKDMGYTTAIADLTAGELGTRGSREVREDEAAKAAGILGLSYRVNLDLGDGKLMNNEEDRESVIRIIRESKPELVLAPHRFDNHPDHVQASDLVKDAFFLASLMNVMPDIEFHRPKGLMYYMCRGVFEPTMIIDVTDFFEKKMEAVNAFYSQLYQEKSTEPETPLSRPEFRDHLHVRAKFYGKMIGCKYGEPFFTEKTPRIEDPIKIW
ncbi:MAG: bacillithiol biosynthesis deacetylase BshB1 [bacterium]|nr:bacillithiol biosynthesis deacetylase BshB1 [bacterium]